MSERPMVATSICCRALSWWYRYTQMETRFKKLVLMCALAESIDVRSSQVLRNIYGSGFWRSQFRISQEHAEPLQRTQITR